jgi:hypothetical protein
MGRMSLSGVIETAVGIEASEDTRPVEVMIDEETTDVRIIVTSRTVHRSIMAAVICLVSIMTIESFHQYTLIVAIVGMSQWQARQQVREVGVTSFLRLSVLGRCSRPLGPLDHPLKIRIMVDSINHPNRHPLQGLEVRTIPPTSTLSR